MRAFGVDVEVRQADGPVDWEGGTRVATGGPLVVERHPARGFLVDGGDLGVHVVAPDGRSVVVHGDPEGALLRGQALPLAATLQGRACLHASAVVVDARALLFAGPSGAGKSTAAQRLAATGAQLLADDVTALEGVLAHGDPAAADAGPFPVASVTVLGAAPAPAVELLLACAFVGWLRDRDVQVALLDACSALAATAAVERG